MAVLNYADQMKYSGKGYLDSKVAPVETLDELTSMSAFSLAKYYQPGMVVLVMNDGVSEGPTQYFLSENYEWKKLVDDSILESRVDEAEEKIETLSSKLQSIANQSSLNKEHINNLSDRLAKISGVERLKAGNNITIEQDTNGDYVISANVEVPEVDLSEIENEINGIKEEIEGINSEIAQNASDIAKNANDIAQHASAINQNSSDIAKNASDIAQQTTLIIQNASDIAKNQEDIAQNTNAISQIDAKVSTIETTVAQTTTDISNINSSITEIEKDINTIEERLNSISGGEGDVAVDNITIGKNTKKEIFVKISNKEGNSLVSEEDGLFSQGIFISGDDADTEIF